MVSSGTSTICFVSVQKYVVNSALGKHFSVMFTHFNVEILFFRLGLWFIMLTIKKYCLHCVMYHAFSLLNYAGIFLGRKGRLNVGITSGDLKGRTPSHHFWTARLRGWIYCMLESPFIMGLWGIRKVGLSLYLGILHLG